MSEKEYRLDICPECKHREGDSSQKELFQCRYCERWFCKRHLEPRLAVTRDLKTTIKDSTWREVVENDWRRKDGHPDYGYTWERLNELKIGKEVTRAKMGTFLDKSKAYRKPVPIERPAPIEQPATIGEHHICPSCGSNHTMTTAYREEFEAFQCLSCNHIWKEWKSDKPRSIGSLQKASTDTAKQSQTVRTEKISPSFSPIREWKPRKRRNLKKIGIRIGYILCLICGIVLSIVGFPFAVTYQSTEIPFLGNYQVHSILFLGSPIYTWDTWNGVVGPIDFFVAFVLNTLVCFIIFLILKSVT